MPRNWSAFLGDPFRSDCATNRDLIPNPRLLSQRREKRFDQALHLPTFRRMDGQHPKQGNHAKGLHDPSLPHASQQIGHMSADHAAYSESRITSRVIRLCAATARNKEFSVPIRSG